MTRAACGQTGGAKCPKVGPKWPEVHLKHSEAPPNIKLYA